MKIAIVGMMLWATVEGMAAIKATSAVEHINSQHQQAIEQAIGQ